MIWKSQHIVIGYTSTGGVVLFLVRDGANGKLRYTPIAKASVQTVMPIA